MPLQMPYTEPRTGVPHPASYWAVERAQFFPNVPSTIVVIGGWHTQAEHAAKTEPFMRKTYSFSDVPLGTRTFAQVVQALYQFVQTNPDDETRTVFFAGATVVP